LGRIGVGAIHWISGDVDSIIPFGDLDESEGIQNGNDCRYATVCWVELGIEAAGYEEEMRGLFGNGCNGCGAVHEECIGFGMVEVG